jgi:D-serine deaminase-like pyridoxal phosphate-dependent protein
MTALDAKALEALGDTRLDWSFKGWPDTGTPIAAIADEGWNGLDDLIPPLMTVNRRCLEHNLHAMSSWCAANGVLLAPHGKTTMAPQLFEWQLALGAYAITVATVAQARVCRHFGVPRLVIANELVRRSDLEWLGDELARDAGFECLLVVDSVDGVDAAATAMTRSGRRVPVLVEVGYEGGRSGCRGWRELTRVAAAVERAQELRLVGIEAYEGLLATDASPASLALVDAFLTRVAELAERLGSDGGFESRVPIISAGGSRFYDRVVAILGEPAREIGARLLLRSGCYATHDHGLYARVSPSSRISIGPFLPAIEVWGAVLSRPEAGMAIVGAGKRDLAFDTDLPQPIKIRHADGRLETGPDLRTAVLNDQHAHLLVGDAQEIEVGDLVGFGISHPCAVFDRWRLVALVEDDYSVLGAIATFF